MTTSEPAPVASVPPPPSNTLLVTGLVSLCCFFPLGAYLMYRYYQQWNAHRQAILSTSAAPPVPTASLTTSSDAGASGDGAGTTPSVQQVAAPAAPVAPSPTVGAMVQDVVGNITGAWSSLTDGQRKGVAVGAGVLGVAGVVMYAMRPVVSGTLVDGITGAPMAGVEIEIEGGGEDCGTEPVQTGEDGSFKIDVPGCSDNLQLRLASSTRDTLVGIGPIVKGETVELTAPLRRYATLEDGVSLVSDSASKAAPSITTPSNADALALMPLDGAAVPSDGVVAIVVNDAKATTAAHGVGYKDGQLKAGAAVKLPDLVPTADGRHAAVIAAKDLARTVTAVDVAGRTWFVRTGEPIPEAPDCDGDGVLERDAENDPFNGVTRKRGDMLPCGDGMSIRMGALQTDAKVDEGAKRLLAEGNVVGDSVDTTKVGSAQSCAMLERAGSDNLRICGLPPEIAGPVVVLAHSKDGDWYADALVNTRLADELAVYALMDRIQRDGLFRNALDEAMGIDARSSSSVGSASVEAPDEVGDEIAQKYRLAGLFPRTYVLGNIATSLVKASVKRDSLAQVHDDTLAWDAARTAALRSLTPYQRLSQVAESSVPSLSDSWFMPTYSACGAELPDGSTEAERASLRKEVVGRYFVEDADVETGDRVGLTLPLTLTVDEPSGLALGGAPAFQRIPEYDCECCNVWTGSCEPPYDGFFGALKSGFMQGAFGVCSCSDKDGPGWVPRRTVSGYSEEWNDDNVRAKRLNVALKSYDADSPPKMEAEVIYTVDSVVRNCADTSKGERFTGRVVGYKVTADGETVSEMALAAVSDAQIVAPPTTGTVPVRVTAKAAPAARPVGAAPVVGASF